MAENNGDIDRLIEKLDSLLKRQETFSKEINELREEINRLKSNQVIQQPEIQDPIKFNPEDFVPEIGKVNIPPIPQMKVENSTSTSPGSNVPPHQKPSTEKYIGENLLSKIGIAITIIGVAIGTKYTIDHDLISPATRIILGYIVGLGLFGFGIRLKKNYENYSAVLVSGAITIMYFITYAAYIFYGMMPQVVAFSIMVIFTVFAVIIAIWYNKQIIALIGLVGAYAVPFLLANGSGQSGILFSYMAIINLGILFIALKHYWKPLYYSSFILTWLIYSYWYFTVYQKAEQFVLSLVFLFIFFATFYLIFLAYKIIQKEKFDTEDIFLLLSNSFIFYGLGYAIISQHEFESEPLGVFTLGNAVIHFLVSLVVYRNRLADRNLYLMVAGLVLIFITIAIPVQLDGNWVTLLWAGEAALLFWIGRTRKVSFYERISYALMILAFLSLVYDWFLIYNYSDTILYEIRSTPFININFLTSILFVAAFVFIILLDKKKEYHSNVIHQLELKSVMSVAMMSMLLIVLYFSFFIEISLYWNQLYSDSAIEITQEGQEYPYTFRNEDLMAYKTIWLINYSLLFFFIMSLVNNWKLRDKTLSIVVLAGSTLCLFIFLIQGLYILSELKDAYLDITEPQYFPKSSMQIWLRYVSYVFVGLGLLSFYNSNHKDFSEQVIRNLKVAFDFLLYTCIIWIASSELITWMEILKLPQSNKLMLSILWGLYALLLIILGIWKKKAHLRFGAIFLFAITLVKLFFYDISNLGTISKTIVFVALGILLLIISFLYNKYKHEIR